jgi:PA domain
MPDEKPYKYENLPIPTYEEATSSRAQTPSLAPLNELGNNEEREGRRNGYRPPTVEDYESPRDSLDDVEFLPIHDDQHSAGEEDEEVRREMQEMEVLDPPAEQSTWTKRISSISRSLSFIHLPFNMRMPNWKFKWPRMNANMFILIGRFFAVVLVMAVVYLIFVSGVFRSAAQRMTGQMYNPENVRIFVQSLANADKIRGYLERLTDFDHIAGTEGDYIKSQLVEGYFAEAKLENVRTEEYYVYLNYPKVGGRAVELLNQDGSVRWAAKIEEDLAYTNPPRQQTLVFHGHSKSGDVKGPLIYANYGSREDFRRLSDSGIETKGAIALVKYYGSQGDRSLKVKAAELAGFAGCIIYSDPIDDGFLKGEVYPNGRYMPADGVQRGSVSQMSWVVGDVLTPGWPSKKGLPRVSKDNNPGISTLWGQSYSQ